MSRERRQFTYTNEDGSDGFVDVSFGPWGGSLGQRDAPIMVDFQDAPWMGIDTAEEFVRWMRLALAEAKRKHVPRSSESEQA